jgi:hypothetical protein
MLFEHARKVVGNGKHPRPSGIKSSDTLKLKGGEIRVVGFTIKCISVMPLNYQ